MAEPGFDDLTDVYEAMVDWQRRMLREGPFFRSWFERVQASRVLDVACGTGHHAALFHSWGLTVEAADISPRMIERAKQQFGTPQGVNWHVRSFEDALPHGSAFDAALCIGNSLSLCPDLQRVRRAVGTMMSAVRTGGIVIIQVLNLYRLPNGPCVWQKHLRTRINQQDVLIVKGVHRTADRGFVELIVSPIDDPRHTRSESVALLGLNADQMQDTLCAAGAKTIHIFGDYQQQPFEFAASSDMILVAQK